MSAPHRTPLRRISHGSLSNLARSASHHPTTGSDDPTRLNFLIPAFSDLADEMATLHSNLENLNHLSQVLETFNESFASHLYALRMNAFCVEWEQAPGDTSFLMAARAAEEARSALASLTMQSNETGQETDAGDATSVTDRSATPAESIKKAPVGILKNGPSKVPKTKATILKEKKAREMKIDRIIQGLPLEFRGNDPDLRRVMEGVIAALIECEPGKRIAEIVKPPILPQARVNKCLIALVNSKLVEKEMTKGAAVYHFRSPS